MIRTYAYTREKAPMPNLGSYLPYQSMTMEDASAAAVSRMAFWRSLPARKWPWGADREYADRVKREAEIIRDAVLRSPIVWC